MVLQMWPNECRTNNLHTDDGHAEKVNRLEHPEELKAPVQGVLGGGTGCLRDSHAVRQAPALWDIDWMSPRKINRRDLSRLYGLDPVPDYIYESIMRADSGKATEGEVRILDHYIKEKKSEIRRQKEKHNLEGMGQRHAVGKIAENSLDGFRLLTRTEEDEDDE